MELVVGHKTVDKGPNLLHHKVDFPVVEDMAVDLIQADTELALQEEPTVQRVQMVDRAILLVVDKEPLLVVDMEPLLVEDMEPLLVVDREILLELVDIQDKEGDLQTDYSQDKEN